MRYSTVNLKADFLLITGFLPFALLLDGNSILRSPDVKIAGSALLTSACFVESNFRW